VDLRVNGTLDARTREQATKLLDTMSGGGVITEYGENRYPCVPRIESVARAHGENYKWWAKLDDDIEIEPEGWDALISCILAAEEMGHEVLCAMADPGGERGPQVLQPAGGVLQTLAVVPEGAQNCGDARWVPCEFVGDGATLFKMEAFESIGYDAAFSLGGADIDLAMQAKLAGFKSLFCGPPFAEHHHKECAPDGYDSLRYDASMIAKSSQAFRAKWGMPCAQLMMFEGRGRR